MNVPSEQAKALFLEATDGHAPEEWPSFLDQACAGDLELRAVVERLLHARAELGSFHENARPTLGATIDAPVSERPGTMIGPYKLLQQIGEGGMGTVYMAEQLVPVKRKVALKVIKPGMDSRQVVARFEAERQALAMMDHVNIARVFDGGTTEYGRPYFVMELVHGVPITKYCDDNHLTPRERLELFVPVCQAIQHAHQKGIIHRDIKPSNVMVTLYDGKPVPKVIDFGVAKATEQKLTERTLFTQYGTMIGTLEYMSPEQAEMSALGVDTRSDIYSLGVLLYELLTGSTPLTHKRMKEAAYAEILRMIKDEEPPRPSTRLSDSGEALASISANRHTEPAKLTKLVRGELDWIVMKTLEKDRGRRYETVNAFAMDMQRYLSNETVLACPPSAGYRFRKFVRRNRRALVTATVLGVALLVAVGAVAGSVGWASRDRAVRQASLEHEVVLALDEAGAAYNRDNLPEALAAVKRAEGLLATGPADAELHQRVRRWRTDLEMVARLDEIRLERSAEKDDSFDHGSADPAYREAFHVYGLDVESLDPAVAVGILRASAVRARLVAALDDWEWTKRWSRLPGAERLRAVARLADPDPWRDRLREVYGRSDAGALAELARDEQVLSLAPETVMLLANALKATKQLPLAVEILRRAQPRHASDFWINTELGKALRALRPAREDESVGFYRAAAALRPHMSGARRNLAWVLTVRGDFAQAKAEYQAAVNLKPDSAISHAALCDHLARSGDRDGAMAALRAALHLKPDSSEVRYYIGDAYRHMGLPDEAIVEYREAIRLKTDYVQIHARAYTHLGLALIAKGLPDEAIVEYRAALGLDPDQPEARGNLADNLFGKGMVDEAVAECHEAIRRNPGHYQGYYTLGRVADKKGAWDEAVAHFSKAIELKPTSAEAHAGLAKALTNADLVEAAIAANRRAIRLKPDYALAHSNLGWALEKLGRFDEALAARRTAVRLEPGSAAWRKGLADALAKLAWHLANHADPKLRDLKRAVELGKEAVAFTPHEGGNWQVLGWVQYRAKNWKASIEALEKSCKLQEGGRGNAWQWFFLSMAHWQLGDKAAARKWYDEAMQLERVWPEELRRFRAETEKLLGIAIEAAPPTKEKK